MFLYVFCVFLLVFRLCLSYGLLLDSNLDPSAAENSRRRRKFYGRRKSAAKYCGWSQTAVNSVSVKEIFQRVTDAWSLKFVRQRENCESMTPR